MPTFHNKNHQFRYDFLVQTLLEDVQKIAREVALEAVKAAIRQPLPLSRALPASTRKRAPRGLPAPRRVDSGREVLKRHKVEISFEDGQFKAALPDGTVRTSKQERSLIYRLAAKLENT